MTLKISGKRLSVKLSRRLRNIPARKRLGEYIRAGWMKRYRMKNTAGDAATKDGERK